MDDSPTLRVVRGGGGRANLGRRPGAKGGAAEGFIGDVSSGDGRLAKHLYADGGPSTTGTVGQVRMNGKEVFRNAVQEIAGAVFEVTERAKVSRHDIDWFVPHQANIRIIHSCAKKLELDESKVIVTIDKHANTSSASIPLALDVGIRDGRIKRGDLLVFAALGGGLAWGSALVRY
ncbi:3-oxoacyl-[acyl-carrier-protein] synthase, KASIII [hydrothermal vent metagenome]|uniref:3-oxoacyl-[acyl-carrier-protein] synthase, KASIII n=1 Tax=hydrothermal vent metagenome TaxID=652676 RepID=A0A3B0SAU6_9ZZZZ